MTLEGIQAVAPFLPTRAPDAVPDVSRALAGGTAGQGDFASLVALGLSKVNGDLIASQTHLQQLALGEGANLHQIMMGLEESRISFQLFMQVRSRLLEAYQDITKMQI